MRREMLLGRFSYFSHADFSVFLLKGHDGQYPSSQKILCPRRKKALKGGRESLFYHFVLQFISVWISKGPHLAFKIIIKIYLSENKEVTLFVQLNW